MDAIALINETRYFWLPAADLILLGFLVREARRLLRAGKGGT
jgi:hypothetical protein